MLSLSLLTIPSVRLLPELRCYEGWIFCFDCRGVRQAGANSEQPRVAASLLTRGGPIIISGSSGYAISDTSELRGQRRDGRDGRMASKNFLLKARARSYAVIFNLPGAPTCRALRGSSISLLRCTNVTVVQQTFFRKVHAAKNLHVSG